ncbi:ABC transporter permease [Rugosimonospora africana]|uniref:ABC transporter n=1 Tax=Rugosimonospora africana TaxID=556532 RepID=A0A8J3VSE6_9ACTN|nr:ABC transporter permease [Rugosimonospora africana]GIH16989.1 ABC transporter [Rugosimonospora africana]
MAVREAVRPGNGPGSTRGGGLGGAIGTEWIKLWSIRSTWWSLLASAVLMAAASLQYAIYATNSNTNADPTDNQGVVAVGKTGIQSLGIAQFAIVALAMLVITTEYSTGTIRATLQWVPRRDRMLLAKTAVAGVVILAAGTLLGILGALVAAPMLGKWGRFPMPGTVADVLAIGVYLALIGLFTLGLGAAMRSAVATLVTVFLILTVVPAVLENSHVTVFVDAARWLPSVAGEHFMLRDSTPYPAGVGLVVVVAWAVAALAAGYLVLRGRDA